MKLEISNTQLEELKELNKNIEELLEFCSIDIELTDTNIKKLDQVVNKVNLAGIKIFSFGGIKKQIVSSNGTKLTIV